jgi:hypothetical protein
MVMAVAKTPDAATAQTAQSYASNGIFLPLIYHGVIELLECPQVVRHLRHHSRGKAALSRLAALISALL